jgi:hypothetical protein
MMGRLTTGLSLADHVTGQNRDALDFDSGDNVTVASLNNAAFPQSGTISIWVNGDFTNQTRGYLITIRKSIIA